MSRKTQFTHIWFLANRTRYGGADATVLSLSVVCNKLCIVAIQCVLEQKLLLTAYRKSHIGIDWYQN